MKQVILDGDIKLIFVKYADSIMFSSIHAELNDENLVRMSFLQNINRKSSSIFS